MTGTAQIVVVGGSQASPAFAAWRAGMPAARTANFDLAQARADAELLGRLTRPMGIATTHVTTIDDVGVLVAKPGQPVSDEVVVHVHGGGYVAGSTNSHARFACALAETTGRVVVLPNYRLAPEYPLEATFEDVIAVYHDLSKRSPVHLTGDSAGGGIALAVAASLLPREDIELPATLVLLSPWYQLRHGEWRNVDTDDPMLSAELLAWMANLCLSEATGDPIVDLLGATALRRMPPVLIQAAEHERLLVEGLTLFGTLAGAGAAVRMEIWRHVGHVFQLGAGRFAEADSALVALTHWMDTNSGLAIAGQTS